MSKQETIASPEKDSDHEQEAKMQDVFGDEQGHQIQYKTLSWQFVALLMIAEIVSNGMLSLPSALAVVGIFPTVFLIVFLGIFALFTAKLLVDFKLNHPEVHSMGDAGLILFGPVGREILSLGTLIFAIFAAGSVFISGQQALSVLTNDGLCAIYLVLIFAIAAFLVSLPRTLGNLTWLALSSCACILVSGIVAMIGSGLNPVPGRMLQVTVSQNFFQAFLAITNPVFAYAGHFMFFIFLSEMKRPQDAMKAAYLLQGFATTYYAVFAVVCYIYVGSTVQSPSFFSLPPVWSKVAFGIALPNFLVAAAIYIHVPAKLVFVRLFRHSVHAYSHTILAWTTWSALCFTGAMIAFILAVSVPIFSYLIGLTAALFASWYTYGVAGFFWLHDAYSVKEKKIRTKKRLCMAVASVLTILAGAFICVAGTYVFIKLIKDAYASGLIAKPFSC